MHAPTYEKESWIPREYTNITILVHGNNPAYLEQMILQIMF